VERLTAPRLRRDDRLQMTNMQMGHRLKRGATADRPSRYLGRADVFALPERVAKKMPKLQRRAFRLAEFSVICPLSFVIAP
jgi:hypothetical protein